MKITPEILSSAIEEYAKKPEQKQQLTPQQTRWFSEPENVFMLITLVITLPEETMDDIRGAVKDWLDVAIAELELVAIHSPKGTKEQFEQAVGLVLEYCKENFELNHKNVLLCVSILKQYQFHIRTDLAQLMQKSEYPDETNVTPFPQKPQKIRQLINEFNLKSSIEFIEVFESGFSVAPPEVLPYILTEVVQYPWGIDALLLLTQYFEESVALASAEMLDQCPSSAWKNLSYLQLVNLCAHFNRHPSVKPYMKRWKKRAMAHHKARAAAEIYEIYASEVDGNDCASMMMKVMLNNQEYQLSMMLDFKSGIRESMLNIDPDQPIPELLEQLSSDINFTPVSPDWLKQILPWILSVQQNKNTPLDLYSLYWIAQLPIDWTQPEAFDLEQWSQKLSYEVNPKRQENSRLGYANYGHNVQSSLMMTWLPPEEYLLKAKKPRDLLKLYYYANKDIFAGRLTYSAAIEKYKLSSEERCLTNEYLDLAHALYDPAINRKRFGLFDNLSEASFQLFAMGLTDTSDSILPQGLVVKISLDEASPAVWRRVHLSNQMTLSEVHDVIQAAMGWEDAHLFCFEVGGITIPEENYDQVCLGLFLRDVGSELYYQYDFGDCWDHQITVEKVLEKDIIQPKVTAGNGTCPVEDSGGIWQWNNVLKLRKKKLLTEEEAEYLELLGLDPHQPLEPFDKQEANHKLAALFSYLDYQG
ncbi:plasmid pRiA4b ORF-3 family protein [Xenorhabdus sp. PB61.4]|uniref:plasmid pRiA4b ORF-3 family protein n=1 Tax=Xenorhabdus sp. PB61.4 TaxID=2788940 RepID=UPI001E2A276F|nr:plasmid pRiA4b ORF-3 family protein [Xenorhabdus sp. PB61.4]MCC8368306.1 plasmid pRiA4b ORF-3 family protein [Xenorhabdus sp. PB61.4]